MIGFSGHLRLRAESRVNGRSVLADQSFQAPFHLSKPYWDEEGRALVVQVVNPTAGILGGDELRSEIAVDRGASVLVTTPSASRVFTMRERDASFIQQFSVAADAWLEVTPEPLVPHRAARFRQSTQVDVELGGGLFFVDQLVPGRIGHGEVWSWDELQLTLTVRVAGDLVLRERLVQSGQSLRQLAMHFGTGDTSCFANAVFIPPRERAEMSGASTDKRDEGVASPAQTVTAWIENVRALHRDGVWVGVSRLRKHGYGIKVVAPDPLRLRDTLAKLREALASAAPALHCRVRKL